MWYNYIRLAFRNIRKQRFFAALNILGLALGMTCSLAVILIIRDQFSYDTFHPDLDRVSRIYCTQPGGMKIATVPFPLGAALTDEYQVAATSTRLIRSIQNWDAANAAGTTVVVNGFFGETSFFEVFGFQLEAGNPSNVLDEPNSVVISRQLADKLFAGQNAIGAILTLKEKPYKITGVVAKPPGKSHLRFDCLVSASSMLSIEQALPPDMAAEKVINNWENYFMTHVYIALQPGKTQADLEKALSDIGAMRRKVGKMDHELVYAAQKIQSITPASEMMVNDSSGGVPWFFIWGLSAFVVILTIFPCLNYANMAVAQAFGRAKEIGVRKAIGAGNKDIRRLIRTEALVTAMLALLVAISVHSPMVNFITGYFPASSNMVDIKARPIDWLIFIVFGLLVGALAGWIPARKFSRLNPLTALKGIRVPFIRMRWRTWMLVGQFVTGLIFTILVFSIWSQMRYMTLADYGFQKENLVTVELQGNKPGILAEAFGKSSRVNGISAASVQVAGSNLQGMSLYKAPGTENIGIHSALVDEKYIPLMGLKLLTGQNFSEMPENSKEKYLILNEKALARFDLGAPAEAIGKVLWLNDSTPVKVQGVIQDFHYRSMESGIDAFALQYNHTNKGYMLHLRLSPGDPQEALQHLESIWKSIDIVHPFKAIFMDDAIQEALVPVQMTNGLIGFFAILALVLASLGLLGMVTYTVSSKVKEIGIRKVMGASVLDITLSLSRQFMLMLGIAIGIALPVGYLLANKFLEIFVYRTTIGGMILSASTGLLLLLGLLTVGIQAARAARANPVDSLRSE